VFMFIQILYFMWCKDELRAASISWRNRSDKFKFSNLKHKFFKRAFSYLQNYIFRKLFIKSEFKFILDFN
jgi:hypothetical protein